MDVLSTKDYQCPHFFCGHAQSVEGKETKKACESKTAALKLGRESPVSLRSCFACSLSSLIHAQWTNNSVCSHDVIPAILEERERRNSTDTLLRAAACRLFLLHVGTPLSVIWNFFLILYLSLSIVVYTCTCLFVCFAYFLLFVGLAWPSRKTGTIWNQWREGFQLFVCLISHTDFAC